MAEGDYSVRAIVSAETSKFESGIKNAKKSVKGMSSEIDALGKQMSSVFSGVAGLFAASKMKSFADETIRAWKYQEKQLKLLSSTLKVTGANAWTSSGELEQFASSLQDVTNYSDETILSMQNVLLGFKNIKGDNFKEATKAILDMSTVMNMDLTSAAQAVGKALDDPIRGINSLTRQGFYFDETQKKLLKSLVESGKQAEAQKIILDELYTTYGGAAEATADLSTQLANTWGDVKEEIGKGLSDITESFSKMIKTMLQGFLDMDESTKDFIKGFAATAAALAAVTAAVFALKAALDVLKAHPLMLGISVTIAGISALVGAMTALSNSVDNEIAENEKLNKEAQELFKNEKDVAEGKTLDAEQTLKLIELYPELSGKVSAYNTTLEEAIRLQKQAAAHKVDEAYQKQREELVKLRKVYDENKKAYEQFQKVVEEDNLREGWGEKAVYEQMAYLKKGLEKSEAEVKKQVTKINANLQSIGMKLAEDGDYLVFIETKLDDKSTKSTDEDVKKKIKTWQEWLSEILKIDESKFGNSGKKAAEIYARQLKTSLENEEKVAEILGMPFEKSSFLDDQLGTIQKKIIETLNIDPDAINAPFEIEELTKENTALGSLLTTYNQLKKEKSEALLVTETKKLNEELDKLTKTDSELYEITLKKNGMTETEIALALELYEAVKKTREEKELLPNLETKILQQQMATLSSYGDEYRAAQERILEIEKERELKNVQSEEARKAIIEYYNNQILALDREMRDAQLTDEEQALQRKAEFLETWSSEYQETQIQILELQRQRELNSTTSEKKIAEINEYYDKKVSATRKKYTKDSIKVVTDSVQALAKEGLTKLGQALVNGSANWQEFKAGALDALGSVLEGISAQLTAMATASLMTQDYKNAMIGFAGAAAALVAAGALSAIADGMRNASDSASECAKSLKEFNEQMSELLENISNPTSLLSGINSVKNTIIELETALADTMGAINIVSTMMVSQAFRAFDKTIDEASVGEFYKGLGKFNKKYQNLYKEYLSLQGKSKELTGKLEIAYKTLNATVHEYNTNLETTIKENRALVASYKDLFDSVSALEALSQLQEMDELTSTLYDVYSNYAKILHNAQLSMLEQTRAGLYEDLVSAGSEIGSTLVDSIIDGAEKEDFLSRMKTYMRTSIINLAVYTEEFNEALANAGAELARAISSGGDLKKVRDDLETLWDTANKNAKEAERVLEEAFGNIADSTNSGVNSVEESLTKLGKMIKDFKEQILDLGGDIANNLVNGIANGLSQADFLDNMKTWLRKMVVQSVVYTESMKAEIENVGRIISDGLSEGFSDEALHTIRRDLSYLFYSTNKQVSSIDSILESVFSGYATGTNNASSGLHLVGEAGPELVRFRGGEQVLNAGNTRQALGNMGGKTNNFNVNFYEMKDTSAFAMLQQLRNYNRQMAINGVI